MYMYFYASMRCHYFYIICMLICMQVWHKSGKVYTTKQPKQNYHKRVSDSKDQLAIQCFSFCSFYLRFFTLSNIFQAIADSTAFMFILTVKVSEIHSGISKSVHCSGSLLQKKLYFITIKHYLTYGTLLCFHYKSAMSLL